MTAQEDSSKILMGKEALELLVNEMPVSVNFPNSSKQELYVYEGPDQSLETGEEGARFLLRSILSGNIYSFWIPLTNIEIKKGILSFWGNELTAQNTQVYYPYHPDYKEKDKLLRRHRL